MRERRCRAAARRRRHRAGPVRLRARVRRREDAQGDHPVFVLRAVARRGRPRGNSRLLRAPCAAAAARGRAHEAAPRRGRGEEPPQWGEQSQRNVPQGSDAEEVLASRVVCEPLHLWMLCSPNRGPRPSCYAATTTIAAARSRSRRRGLRSHLPGSVLGEATPLSGIDDTDITPPSALAAHDAYEEAGIGPEDVNVVECQDTDAARSSSRTRSSGCASRVSRPRSWLGTTQSAEPPRRTRAVGCCRRASRSAHRHSDRSIELVHQLRGEAGPRQVDGARSAWPIPLARRRTVLRDRHPMTRHARRGHATRRRRSGGRSWGRI